MKRGRKPLLLSPSQVERYRLGAVTVAALARECGWCRNTVAAALRRAGLPGRHAGGRPRLEVPPELAEQVALGRLTRAEVARRLRRDPGAVTRALRRAGVPRGRSGPPAGRPHPLRKDGRNAEARRLRAAGWTLGQLALRYGITRERARQISAKEEPCRTT